MCGSPFLISPVPDISIGCVYSWRMSVFASSRGMFEMTAGRGSLRRLRGRTARRRLLALSGPLVDVDAIRALAQASAADRG